MNKKKVAIQFISELSVITLTFIIIGTAIGALVSTPITNNLLSAQIEQVQNQAQEQMNNFGRPVGNQGEMTRGGDVEGPVEYISSTDSSIGFSLIVKMIFIGLGFTAVAGSVSILFIMRYEPLKILTDIN